MPGNLVIRLKGMGDIIHLIPALRVLRHNFPSEDFFFLCQKPFGQIVPSSLKINLIEVGKKPSTLETLRLIKFIRSKRFDRLFDFFGNPRTAIISLFSAIPWRAGFDYRVRKYAYHTVFRPPDSNKYLPELFREFLEFFKIEGPVKSPELQIEESAMLKASDFFLGKKTGKPLLGVNPHATYPSKAWPIKHFENFIRLWHDNTGERTIVFWGPGEQPAAQRLIESLSPALAFTHPPLALRELAAFISKLDVFLTTDSGPMNLAWAMGIPTVALFGPTTRRAVSPRGPNHLVLFHPNLSCLECHKEVCKDGRCMSEISPHWVLQRMTEKFPQWFSPK
ncbi:glycosyltransferase family 9 protein [bacterium]|nr:glycosyltransferase family 9 protein [bacterium]